MLIVWTAVFASGGDLGRVGPCGRCLIFSATQRDGVVLARALGGLNFGLLVILTHRLRVCLAEGRSWGLYLMLERRCAAFGRLWILGWQRGLVVDLCRKMRNAVALIHLGAISCPGWWLVEPCRISDGILGVWIGILVAVHAEHICAAGIFHGDARNLAVWRSRLIEVCHAVFNLSLLFHLGVIFWRLKEFKLRLLIKMWLTA